MNRIWLVLAVLTSLSFAGCDRRLVDDDEAGILDQNDRLPESAAPPVAAGDGRVIVVPPSDRPQTIVIAPDDERGFVYERSDSESFPRITDGLYPPDPFTDNLAASASQRITLRGVVMGHKKLPLGDGHTGMFVRLKVGGEFPDVYLGPEEWLFDHGVTPELTELMTVIAAPVSTNEGRAYVAYEVAIDGTRLVLRNETGDPAWPIESDQ